VPLAADGRGTRYVLGTGELVAEHQQTNRQPAAEMIDIIEKLLFQPFHLLINGVKFVAKIPAPPKKEGISVL
jgi:hypothetical protein